MYPSLSPSAKLRGQNFSFVAGSLCGDGLRTQSWLEAHDAMVMGSLFPSPHLAPLILCTHSCRPYSHGRQALGRRRRREPRQELLGVRRRDLGAAAHRTSDTTARRTSCASPHLPLQIQADEARCSCSCEEERGHSQHSTNGARASLLFA